MNMKEKREHLKKKSHLGIEYPSIFDPEIKFTSYREKVFAGLNHKFYRFNFLE